MNKIIELPKEGIDMNKIITSCKAIEGVNR